MIMPYRSNYVEGLCLLPVYVVLAVTLGVILHFHIVISLVVMVLVAPISSGLYNYVVVRDSEMARWQRYWLLFFGQIFFFLAVYKLIITTGN